MKEFKNVKRVKPGGLELTDRLVGVQRVVKVTKGGRTFGFSAIVVVGDESGVAGYGMGKSKEVSEAITKGIEDAKKNLVKIPVVNQTVPHEQEASFGGATVFLRPASNGTGVIAGGAMRAVLESAGVQDVLAKSKGSSNPHNVVKATFKALMMMRDAREVARSRGIAMSKVFNGSSKEMSRIRLTQIRSTIKRPARQVKTMEALGLRKINSSVEHNVTPQIMGMVERVRHLLKVEELEA